MPLSKRQTDELEDAALKAFAGSLSALANGFRIQTGAGQVAAVYWSDLAPGNEIEMALAPARLTDKYDLPITQAWVATVKSRYPSACKVHKHGSDWPIVGLQYGEALALLSDCQKLRKGVLTGAQEAEIARWRAAQSPEESTAARLAAQLEALRPRHSHAVIDLVRRAGVSVDRWFVRADGTPAVSPRSNPAYCYNWSFGGGQEPAVASLWHASMKVLDGSIQFQSNLRALATRLKEIAVDPARPVEHRERARPQAARARHLDDLIRGCATAGRDVRVIVNEGDMRDESSLGEDSSFVKVRLLDAVPWSVASYDPMTGECRLQRKASTRSLRPVARPLQWSHRPRRALLINMICLARTALNVRLRSRRAPGAIPLCDLQCCSAQTVDANSATQRASGWTMAGCMPRPITCSRWRNVGWIESGTSWPCAQRITGRRTMTVDECR